MGARMLVIEDNDASRELVRYLLVHAGHDVSLAADGEAGLEAALRDPPDLVICDVRMPRLDGYQVLAHLRAEPATRHIPVVAVTAFSMREDRHRVAAAGFNGHLTKPIDPESFVATIERHLRPGSDVPS